MKNQSYNEFWQRIHQYAKSNGFPLRVMFELTYRCNFKCRHCYVPQSYRNKKGELKTKEVFSILDQLKDIGCFYLGFTGGEPFVRKDIIDILLYAKKKGFEIIIYTNGSLIDEKIASQLKHLKLNKVDITLPAISKLAFERISGVSGSRDKVFNTIKLLCKKGINLGFKTCILKENESEINQIKNFTASFNSLHRLDDSPFNRLDGSKEPLKHRGILREKPHATRRTPHTTILSLEMSNVQREACNVKREACNVRREACSPTQNIGNLFKCGVGQTQAAITPLGELKMCLLIDYPKYRILHAPRSTLHAPRHTLQATGNTSKDKGFLRAACSVQREAYSLKEAWKKLKELVTSIKPDENYKCDKCEFRTYCKWCPARGWLENRNFSSCDPEIRSWIKTRIFNDVNA